MPLLVLPDDNRRPCQLEHGMEILHSQRFLIDVRQQGGGSTGFSEGPFVRPQATRTQQKIKMVNVLRIGSQSFDQKIDKALLMLR